MSKAVAFEYPRARVSRIIDGDTVQFNIDLGFGIWKMGEIFRLRNANAWEMSNQPEGLAAKDYVENKLQQSQTDGYLPLFTFMRNRNGVDMREKFGRFLFDVRLAANLVDPTADKELWLSEAMCLNGHARRMPKSMYIEDPEEL